jgi:hypothetical protein
MQKHNPQRPVHSSSLNGNAQEHQESTQSCQSSRRGRDKSRSRRGARNATVVLRQPRPHHLTRSTTSSRSRFKARICYRSGGREGKGRGDKPRRTAGPRGGRGGGGRWRGDAARVLPSASARQCCLYCAWPGGRR